MYGYHMYILPLVPAYEYSLGVDSMSTFVHCDLSHESIRAAIPMHPHTSKLLPLCVCVHSIVYTHTYSILYIHTHYTLLIRC